MVNVDLVKCLGVRERERLRTWAGVVTLVPCRQGRDRDHIVVRHEKCHGERPVWLGGGHEVRLLLELHIVAEVGSKHVPLLHLLQGTLKHEGHVLGHSRSAVRGPANARGVRVLLNDDGEVLAKALASGRVDTRSGHVRTAVLEEPDTLV